MILKTLILLFISSLSWGTTISGYIWDSKTGEPISNVNLFIPSQNVGTASQEDGSFIFSFHYKDNTILQVSHIGYSSKKILLNETTESLSISLNENFFEAEDVVITSTRTKKIHKNVPIATEIITTKEINNSGSQNVSELLSLRAGVSLQTSVDGGSMLNILGMDSRYILILIDGQPITGKFNNRVDLSQIPTSDIKKIEIIKGPSSSLYGSEAMAGVLNIITKSNNEKNSLNISAGYNGTQSNIKSEGFKKGSTNLKLFGSKSFNIFNLSFNADITSIPMDKSIQQIDIDNINKQSIRTNLFWDPSLYHQFNFSESLYNHKEDGSSSTMNTITDILRNNFSISHAWFLNNEWEMNHSFQHQFYRRKHLQVRSWGEIITNDVTSENSIEYENIFHKKIGEKNISFGVESSYSSYVSDRVENGKQTISTNSLFGQIDIHTHKNVGTILGTRIDKYSNYKIVVSPRLGFIYIPVDHWKFRATWGKGFRAPSFVERFIDWYHADFDYTVIGNPDLKPETSTGYTAGIEYYLPSHYQVSIMLYYNIFNNMIHDYSIEPKLLSYNNINKAEYKGIELQGRWSISNSWGLSWGLNIIDNRDQDGNMIPNTQPLSSSTQINYQPQFNQWDLSLKVKWVDSFTPNEYDPISGTYISSERMNAYHMIDIIGNLKYWEHLTLSIGIKNISNHTNTNFGPFIGRSFYIKIKTTLINGEGNE